MFRHRKRLISKRLSKLMQKRNEKYMKELLAKFIASRSQQVQDLVVQQQEQSVQEEISEQEIQEETTQQMTLSDYISSLSAQEKRQFKQENPDLPPTFFMSKKEKQKFFSKKNQKFQNDLKHTPARPTKNVHRVQFKEKFNYKPFNNFEKATEVKKAKEFNIPYNNKIHFS